MGATHYVIIMDIIRGMGNVMLLFLINDLWNSFVVLVMMGMLTVIVIHSRQTGTTTAAEVNVLAIIQDVIRNAPSRKLVGWDQTQTCITVAMTGRRLVHCPIHHLIDQLLHRN